MKATLPVCDPADGYAPGLLGGPAIVTGGGDAAASREVPSDAVSNVPRLRDTPYPSIGGYDDTPSPSIPPNVKNVESRLHM